MLEIIEKIAPLFQNHHTYSPRIEAQRNLNAITHYVSDDTLRFFGARVLYASDVEGGLFYLVVDSAKTSFTGDSRACRFSVFDVFGKQVHNSDRAFTKKKALDEAWAYLNTLDTKEYYKEALLSRVGKLSCEISNLNAALEELSQ